MKLEEIEKWAGNIEDKREADYVEYLLSEVKRLREVIRLQNRVIDHYLPCPDHRDKVESGRCYVCEVEKLRAFIEKLERRRGG